MQACSFSHSEAEESIVLEYDNKSLIRLLKRLNIKKTSISTGNKLSKAFDVRFIQNILFI